MHSGISAFLPLLCLVGGVAALPAHQGRAPEFADDVVPGSLLPGRWYHGEDHVAHALFRRQDGGGAQVGSPTWSAAYPTSTPDSSAMPQEWKDALDAAVQAGKIPNLDPSTQTAPGTNPIYGKSDPTDPSICSATYKCRIDGQIWDAPDGTLGLGFDDGPLPASDNLYAFLQKNELHATHFFIGVNVVNNWKEFLTAFQTNEDDIAVHTWTHPYMTTLSSEDVVAQLGWTIQVIYDSTGGKLPAFWRPPYGDADVRVTAIAQEVFGLTTIVWNQDTEDWSIGDGQAGAATPAGVHSDFEKWLSGTKSPGLIVLEHELSDASVQAFMDAYPLMTQYGWNLTSIAQLNGGAWQDDSGSSSSSNGSFPLPGSSSSLPLSVSTAASATASSSASASHTSTASASGNSSASDQSTSSGAPAVGLHGKTIPTSILLAVAGILAGLIFV